jgi:uncharacterized protein (TIGR02466 family)
MKIVDPWSPVIFKDHCPVQNWEGIKKRADNLLSNTPSNSQLELGDSLSSVITVKHGAEPPYSWSEFEYFINWLRDKIPEIERQWKLSYNEYTIAGSWINRHYRTGKTAEHCHRGCEIVVTYYLHVPENSGRFIARDPMENHWNNTISHERGALDLSHGYPIEVKTGDVLFFPGWLLHSTEESNSDEGRYVMSTNFSGKK